MLLGGGLGKLSDSETLASTQSRKVEFQKVGGEVNIYGGNGFAGKSKGGILLVASLFFSKQRFR